MIDSYDTAGRKIGLLDPDRGNESYTYDANGNLTKSVGPAGTTFTGYGALNRPILHNVTNGPTTPGNRGAAAGAGGLEGACMDIRPGVGAGRPIEE